MLRRAEGLRSVPRTISIVREDDVGAALTRALVDRTDALAVIGTAAARTLAEVLDPGVWPAALHATGRPALVVGPKVVEGVVRLDRLVVAVTASRQPRRFAQAVCTWADTFDRDVVRSANVPILLVPTNELLSVEPGTGPGRGGSRRRGPPR